MSDLPLEQPVPPTPPESKTIVINSEQPINEDDFTPSPEQQAQQERLAKRSALALPIINKIIPSRTFDQEYDAVSSKPLFKDKSEEVIKGEAERRHTRELAERNSLASTIAWGEIPETELEDYISTIYEIAKDISPNSSRVQVNDIDRIVKSIETTEQAHIFHKYSQEWKQRFLTGVDDEAIVQRKNELIKIFGNFSGVGRLPKPEPRTQEEMDGLFNIVSQGYEIAYSLPVGDEERKIATELTSGIMRVGLETRNSPRAERILRIFKQVGNNPDRALVSKFMETVNKYGIHHEITEETMPGLTDKLFAAMEKQDPQVDILLKGNNIWGMRNGDFGAADFLVHCYSLKISPANLADLLLAAREAPSTVFAIMEKNRKDAGSISRSSASSEFSQLREIVHDQRPGANELLEALVSYYDTNVAPRNLSSLLIATGYYGKDSGKDLLIRDFYEKPVVDSDRKTPTGEKIIDVIRRLAKNTEPVPDNPPLTSDPKLNEVMQGLFEVRTKREVPKESLGQTVDYVNSMLFDMMQKGEVGIEPNNIQAISWLERRAFETMQGLTYEDQSQAYRQPWFISVLRFQELTCSPHDFNETEFQSFITKVQSAKSDREAFQLIGTRALEGIYQLAKIQSDRGRMDTGGLWSGNLPHELIGLVDPRSAETEAGRRARNEDIIRVTEPGYHPGD